MSSADEATVREALKMAWNWAIVTKADYLAQQQVKGLAALHRLQSNGNGNSAQVAAAMAAAPKPVPFLTVPDGELPPGECPTGL